MFDWSVPEMPSVPNPDVTQYDIAPGVDLATQREAERIRGMQGGEAMRQRALVGLGGYEDAASGRESAARMAARIAMERSNAERAASAAAGSPLAARQAMAAQAAARTTLAGQAMPAISAEQLAAQKAYIQAAQGQRAQDIRKMVGLEEIAQREQQMGLQSKWDAAKAAMDFEREKLRKAGIDVGIWDAAARLAAARTAAETGAIGAAGGTLLNYLGSLGGDSASTTDAAKAAYGFSPNMTSSSTGTINPNFSV